MDELVLWSTTRPALGVPHRIELVRSGVLPPEEQISAAFVLVVDRRSRLLLAFVEQPGRGWDVPGGHRDRSESPRSAAVRELLEETGFAIDEDALEPVGFTRFVMEARPATWPYPYPISCMVFFAVQLRTDGPDTTPPPDSECSAASWFAPGQIRNTCADPDWLPLLDEPGRPLWGI